MKKALIYDPYLDTLGGGERYVLTFALALESFGYSVDIAWKDETILTSAHKRFNLKLKHTQVCPECFDDLSLSAGLLRRYQKTKEYDLVFWISDGSLPYLFGKKNYLHFQVPFSKIGGNPLNTLLKTLQINRFIFNSNFTAKVISRQLQFISSDILFPPIDVDSFIPGKKEDVILSVARFDSPSHAKRQDVLIEVFKKLFRQRKNYRLILTGAVKGDGGNDYLSMLSKAAGKLPVELVPNPDFNELKKLYAKAKIFWHAAGYGVNDTLEPEKVEHFGITTVEAMSAGAVPVVINRGGQGEIITSENGYLCDSIEEMVSSTLFLINSPEKMKQMAENSTSRSLDFSIKRFIKKVGEIIQI